MSNISEAARSAREGARQSDGKFGSYELPEADVDADLDIDFLNQDVPDVPFGQDERTCYRCGVPLEGGTWCDDCSDEDSNGPLQPLGSTAPTVPAASTPSVPEGMLPIDISGLQVNRYAPAPGEEFANPIENPDDRAVDCPKCQDAWGSGADTGCDLCQDEDGFPVPYYANADFLRRTMDYSEWGLQVAPAIRATERMVDDGGSFLGAESVGTEHRVQTRYATNHPHAPYLVRTATSYIEAVGPDGEGYSRNYERSEIARMMADGVDFEEEGISFQARTEVTYSLFNSTNGMRYGNETSLVHDVNTDDEPAYGDLRASLEDANWDMEAINGDFSDEVDYDASTRCEFDAADWIKQHDHLL